MTEEAQNPESAILLIGVGNEYRGDDGVGLFIARQLKARRLPNTVVIEEAGDATALMEAWKGANTVFLFDAVSSDSAPGTIHRFDAHVQPIPAKFFRYSTHAFSVAEAVELARVLDQLPPHLVVYGVEGNAFDASTGLSAEVKSAAHYVLERVVQEVESTLGGLTGQETSAEYLLSRVRNTLSSLFLKSTIPRPGCRSRVRSQKTGRGQAPPSAD